MKINEMQDERILLEKRQIQSIEYTWLVTLLLISIVVQQFLMQAPFAQYAVEFFALIGCGIYNVIANYKKGIDIWNPSGDKKSKIFIRTFISGIASVIIFALLSGNYQINYLASYFATFVVFFYVIRLIMIRINNRKLQAIDRELNDDDDITE